VQKIILKNEKTTEQPSSYFVLHAATRATSRTTVAVIARDVAFLQSVNGFNTF